MKWEINNIGIISRSDGSHIGFFDTSGEIYDKDNIGQFGQPIGNFKGFVDINGDTYDNFNSQIGSADFDGVVYNKFHSNVATVKLNGEVYDMHSNLVGNIDPRIHITVSKPDWCPMVYRAAAAVILILYGEF